MMSLALAGVIGLLSSTSASADPYNGTLCGVLAVSSTTATPGEQITVIGHDFAPNTAVRLTLVPAATPAGPKTHFGPVTTDSTGQFTLSITIPSNAVGSQLLSSDGIAANCPADTVTLLALGAGSSAPGGTQSPAVTGVDIALIGGLAVAALAIGLAFTLGGRRRHR